MFDSILFSSAFRDGFSSLLGNGTATAQPTEEGTASNEQQHIEGGRVARSAVYVNSPKLAMKVCCL